ncbi:MAG: membrane protein insertion efficiency factor YidD [Endomicrobia bacterium]|nr:membrane protein insertion efficiency factor YidD [Endomicrobiia bacterium]MCX7716670.1 membrane protein insertion efficiency factor YidD [Endomicrobiia bacterium]
MMKLLIFIMLSLYKKFISPFLGNHCRFYPSCSEYAYLAIEKYGIFAGIFKSLIRLLKCHPFHPGGIDFP